MIIAKFDHRTTITRNGVARAAWVVFVREVDADRPDQFRGRAIIRHDTPEHGWTTEDHPGARIVRSQDGNPFGVHVIALSDGAEEAFEKAAARIGVDLDGTRTFIRTPALVVQVAVTGSVDRGACGVGSVVYRDTVAGIRYTVHTNPDSGASWIVQHAPTDRGDSDGVPVRRSVMYYDAEALNAAWELVRGRSYPHKNAAGETVWSCCESLIGPDCQHRTAPVVQVAS